MADQQARTCVERCRLISWSFNVIGASLTIVAIPTTRPTLVSTCPWLGSTPKNGVQWSDALGIPAIQDSVSDGPWRRKLGLRQLRESSGILASLKPNRLVGRPRTQCALRAPSTSEFSAVLRGATWDVVRCCQRDTCRALGKFRTRAGHGAPQRKTG